MNDMKADLMVKFEEALKGVNAIANSGTAAQVEAKLSALTAIENDLRTVEEREIFSSCPDVKDAIEKHRFEVVSHRKLSENGHMTGVERSSKMIQVDLKKFCEYRQLPLDWYYELQALNKRLTLRVATSLNMKGGELRNICDSYAMDKMAEQISLGGTPTSNSQCVAHMQRILDMLCPGAGRINGYDLAYVMAGYSKRSNKEALKIICSKHSVLLSLMGDVFFNVLKGVGYGVDYKRKPSSTVSAEKADKVVEQAKAAETASEDAPKAKTGRSKTKGKRSRGSKKSATPDTGAEQVSEAEAAAEDEALLELPEEEPAA